MDQSLVEQDQVIKTERDGLARKLETLEETEGFHLLTERQKRIIKQSLYIQQRAERGTDEASRSAIISPKTHVTDITQILPEVDIVSNYDLGLSDIRPEDRKYRESQNIISDWYCFASIANLEAERGLVLEPPELPNGFFKADFHRVNGKEELTKNLEKQSFPCVVIISPKPNSENPMIVIHAFLALGHDSDGKIVVWDKQGYMYPFRVTDLDELYKKFKELDSYWGTRKLDNLRDKSV